MNPLRWLWNELLGRVDDTPGPNDFVTIGTANEAVGGLWRSTLEGQQIPCLVKEGGPYSFGGPTIIQVEYKNLARARALLGLDET